MGIKYKFKKDGTKVLVIGNLNATEFIVQDILIDENDNEVPSGINIIVDTLYDFPATTYLSRKNEEMERRIEELEQEEMLLKQRVKETRKDITKLDKFFTASNRFLSTLDEETFDFFHKFMTGKYRYAVRECSYSSFEIFDFMDSIYSDDYKDVKLLSFFGKIDKGWKPNIHRYSDGSGDSDTYKFFEKREDALKFLFDRFLEDINTNGRVHKRDYKFLVDEGVKFSMDILEKIKDNILSQREEEIKHIDSDIRTRYDRINKEYDILIDDINLKIGDDIMEWLL